MIARWRRPCHELGGLSFLGANYPRPITYSVLTGMARGHKGVTLSLGLAGTRLMVVRRSLQIHRRFIATCSHALVVPTSGGTATQAIARRSKQQPREGNVLYVPVDHLTYVSVGDHMLGFMTYAA
jgi:hypothetical protein